MNKNIINQILLSSFVFLIVFTVLPKVVNAATKPVALFLYHNNSIREVTEYHMQYPDLTKRHPLGNLYFQTVKQGKTSYFPLKATRYASFHEKKNGRIISELETNKSKKLPVNSSSIFYCYNNNGQRGCRSVTGAIKYTTTDGKVRGLDTSSMSKMIFDPKLMDIAKQEYADLTSNQREAKHKYDQQIEIRNQNIMAMRQKREQEYRLQQQKRSHAQLEFVAKANKESESFRKKLAIGDDTNCGLVIEVKAPIAKIQTEVGERWMKINQLYKPHVMPCR